MSRSTARRAPRNDRYTEGLASVLTTALKRRGMKKGDQAVLIAARPLGGAEDGGPAEILCGTRPNYPPKVELLDLSLEERRVAEHILAESLEDPAFEPWSDMVVGIRVRTGGIEVAGMPRPLSALDDPAQRRNRERYLANPPLARLESLLAMMNGR